MVADYPLQERRRPFRIQRTFCQPRPPQDLWKNWLRRMSANPRLPVHTKFTGPQCMLKVFSHLTSQAVIIQDRVVRSAVTQEVLAHLS